MTMPPVSTVEPESIAGEEAPHDRGDRNSTASEKEVKVIGNQRPRIACGLGGFQDLA